MRFERDVKNLTPTGFKMDSADTITLSNVMPYASSFDGITVNSLALAETNRQTRDRSFGDCCDGDATNDDDYDTMSPHNTTIGAEENNANIQDDEFVIGDNTTPAICDNITSGNGDGEIPTYHEKSYQKEHHFHTAQLTNLANEGVFDNAITM